MAPGREGTTRSDTCGECVHFVDDPRELERAFPGIHALSSVYGSTRGRCGICRVRETFQDPAPACPDFRARRGSAAGLADGVTAG